MKRNMLTLFVVTAAVFAAVGTPAAASASSTGPRDPAAPGCSVTTMTADPRSGVVHWNIACAEERTVVVDATAFSGTPDDHEIVDEAQASERVPAGATWTSSLQLANVGVDQLRAEAVTFASLEDPWERPAIIGGAIG